MGEDLFNKEVSCPVRVDGLDRRSDEDSLREAIDPNADRVESLDFREAGDKVRGENTIEAVWCLVRDKRDARRVVVGFRGLTDGAAFDI